MEKDYKREIEEIIGAMECPKDFLCYKSGLENLCKAKDIGVESLLECLEKEPQDCNFSISFGYSYFCQCPLRIYLAKKLSK
jgi:hypothetical protein